MAAFDIGDEEYLGKVLERFNSWHKTAGMTIQRFDENPGLAGHNGIIQLNESLLFLAAKAYFDDIYKFKIYSGSEKAEPYKLAGYTLKWIAKIKPLQLICPPKYTVPDAAMQINGFYAIACAVSHLNIELEDVTAQEKLIKDLLYNTLYRNISGKSYAITFRLLEELVQASKQPVPQN
jgi:hypothetical protein